MKAVRTSLLPVRLQRAIISRRCPQCGSRMKELHRLEESGLTYVWYRCSERNCDGQWMRTYVGFVSIQSEE